jgi:nucleotide-binding universal stress UspA family protein
MVPNIKKILFTTDLSQESRQALDYAISLATQYGADITILYVMEESQWSTGDLIKNTLGEERWQQLRESREQEVKQILIGKKKEGALIREALNEFCETAQKDHKECEFIVDDIVVARGVVVDEIIHDSEEKNCDLIVMGYHARGALEQAFLGSTTRRVLRRSKIPVLLVRLEKNKP